MWVCDATRPALVLGSAQPTTASTATRARPPGSTWSAAAAGAAPCWSSRARCCGSTWCCRPATSLWQDDVGRAFHWVGEAWAAALGELGVTAAVHRGRLVRATWSAEVCFAGLGPGEVTVEGRKVVGISQRRTRAAARFQCAALGRWDPAAIVPLLGLPPAAADDLARRGGRVGVDLEPLLAALLRHLP